jgi:UDP-N-acetylmuramoyl-L-alanyl-D-glutamate--2,6-diaminopimelate ligase
MKRIYHFLKSYISILPFIFVRSKAKIIGITGTDGKTTVTTLIYDMFANEGLKVACLTTVGVTYKDGFIDTGLHTTTPSAYELHKYISQFRDYDYIIVEATSQGIDQYRVAGIKFAAAVYTNITTDHLDYHKSWENYANAKSKLTKYLTKDGFALINMDDKKSFKYLSNKFNSNNIKYFKYSVYSKNADIKAYNVTEDSFDVRVFNKDYAFKTSLLGEYNIQNSIACIFVALKFEISQKSIQKTLKNPPYINGRFDIVSRNPLIVVDFAHTPNSIYNVLDTLKNLKKSNKSRIITIFGAPGERDKFKRPLMGKNASIFSDVIIITSDDPRFDDMREIYSDIIKDIDILRFIKDKNLFRIDDRSKAIDFALELANKNDIIALLGKGHEKSLAIKGHEIPWSDKEYVLKKIKKRHGKK